MDKLVNDFADRRTLNRIWLRLRSIHYGFFLGVCLLAGLVAVFSLRNNNQQMIRLRTAVFAADQNNGDVETVLRTLREYVYGHMNTNLSSGNNPVKPPIQLKYRYERLVSETRAFTEAARSQVYLDAQAYCERLLPTGVSATRVPCVKAYVDTHPIPPAKTIPDDLYKFDFVSPTWSPDMAGWSIVVAALSFALFIVSALSDRLLRYELRS